MIRLGVLGSTRGTHLSSLVSAIANEQLDASIELVLSNKADAGILALARHLCLKTNFTNPADLSREEYDAKVSAILKQNQIDLIVLVGYMRILSNQFVKNWENKIINVHPSLLPKYAGMMDMAVHQAVLNAGEQETGCTVHFVTEELDAGPVLIQEKCLILHEDTPETIKQRVQALEAEALIKAIKIIK